MRVWDALSQQKTPVRVYETPFIADVRLIAEAAQKRGGVAKKLFYTAIGMSADAVKLKQAGKPVPLWMRAPLALFDFTTAPGP